MVSEHDPKAANSKPVFTGELAVAVCPKHGTRMFVGRRMNLYEGTVLIRVTRYCYCRVPGCMESDKVVSSG